MNTGRELRKEFFLNLIVAVFTVFFGLIVANIFFLTQPNMYGIFLNVICACVLIWLGVKITDEK